MTRGLNRFLLSSLTAVGLVFAASSASAVTVISNMPGNDGTSTFVNAALGGSNGGGVFNSKAAGFTMPATVPYNLNFVTLRLEMFNTDSAPVVQIYDSVGGLPTNLMHTLTTPAPVVGISNVDFTSAGFSLNASTTYWVVVWNNAAVANSFRWLSSTPTQTPTGIATHFGYRFSNGGPPPTGSSTTFNTYSVEATPVPEPATLAALSAGLLLLRRKRK